MSNKISKKFILRLILPIFLFGIIAFVIDRVTKEVILMYFIMHPNPVLINSFFSLELIYNYGISFSFLNNLNSNLIIIVSIVALMILLLICFRIFNVNSLLLKLAIGFIIGASFGNIYDRVTFGAVIDFFYFHYKQWGFPVFNTADVLITFSAIILFVNLIFRGKQS